MLKKLLVWLAAGLPGLALAQTPTTNPPFESRPGEIIICPSRPESMGTRVLRPALPAGQRPLAGGADITVTYTGFTPQAQAAFQAAVDIWKTLVSSSTPIRINANWSALARGVLGSAGPTTFVRNFPGALQANVWYPIALAEKLAGQNLNGNTAEISANFSSSAPWYYGTDGRPAANQYDLVSVVLHELCHGLGFVAGTGYDAPSGQGTYGFGDPILPLTFTTFIENAAGQRLVDTGIFQNPSAGLGTEFVSGGLYFDGPLAVRANPQAADPRPRLYAPSPYSQGSSISHLDEATYPAGNPNSLMTYAIGAGEAIQDPGPLTLGMFSDMGWFATMIRHSPLRDSETAQDFAVVATIVSDGTITPGSVRLTYSVNNGAPQTVAMTASGGANQFRAVIPNPGLNATVRYFLQAADNETGRTYTAPGQPAPGVTGQAVYQFFVGPDRTPPVVLHTPPSFLFDTQLPFTLVARATDNIAVASVQVPYSVNGVARPPLTLAAQPDGVTYSGTLSTAAGPINAGDVISYQVVATDVAAAANRTTLGPFAVPVVSLRPAQSSYLNNFNAASSDFVGNGFSITRPSAFADPAIHSVHPYADQTELVYNLLVPIVVQSDPTLATIKFDEIALVEPGEPGSVFGTPEFYDYVVVEGSTDGVSWTPVADGWDARANAQWLSTWRSQLDADGNSLGVGTPALFAPRTLNLRNRFAAGAVVRLRFRLFADEGAHGWGWAIDNLNIQGPVPLGTRPDALTAGGLSVFPSPSADGRVQVVARLANPTAGLEVQVRNALGQVVRRQALPGTLSQVSLPLDLPALAPGLYFVSLSGGGQTATTKLVLGQ